MRMNFPKVEGKSRSVTSLQEAFSYFEGATVHLKEKKSRG